MRRCDHRQRFLGALALCAATSCAAKSDTFLDITYDPCNTEVAPNETATADEIASLDAALTLWNERGDFRLSRRTDAEPGAPPALPVSFQREFGAFRGFYDDEAGEVIINRGLSDAARTIAIAHELGHAFGLWHVDSSARRSVMNPGNTTVEPSPRDVDDVRALWGRCR